MTIGTGFSNTGYPKYASVAQMKSIDLQPGATVETIAYYDGWLAANANPKGGGTYQILTLPEYTAITGKVTADAAADHALNNGNVAFLIRGKSANILQYGARGDGSTDDVTKIQAAFSSGFNVYIPEVDKYSSDFYRISVGLLMGHSGQKVFGDGYGSIIRQVTANQNVIEGSTLDNLIIEGIHCYGVGSFNSINNGQGIHLFNCNNALVKDNFIENHRGKGIGLRDCEDCIISGNRLFNSPVTDSDTHGSVQSDIALYYSCKRNIVSNNFCKSGQGIGISIQTISSGDDSSDNIVENNVVEGSRMYGMQVYRLNAGDVALRNKFISNSIKDISGITAHDTDGRVYGSGIYIQAAEYTLVVANTVENTNISTVVDQLAPAGIGATNVTNVSIIGNNITNANWFGVTLRDPTSQGIATGFGKIHDNNINICSKAAIHILNRNKVSIKSNTIDNLGSNGIHVANTATRANCIISGNNVKSASGSNIIVNEMNECLISGNICKNATVTGITISNSDIIKIENNLSKDNAVRGIQVQTTCSNVTLADNTVTGNAAGMLIQAVTKIGDNNQVYSNTTEWSGAFQIISTLDDSGTPSVKDGKRFKTGGLTAITDFDEGEVGQTLIILAAHTVIITNGAPIRLQGGANFSMAPADILVLEMFDDQIWHEVSRSEN